MDSPAPDVPTHVTPPQRQSNKPVVALILATVFWGCGFTWAKAAGESVNAAGGFAAGAPLGPIWVLAARFLAGGILWLIIFPDSRRNWTRSSLIRALILGGNLAAGMVVQHLGLDRTSEHVSAFLTSLTIVFVPVMMTFLLRKPPRPAIWIGVILATAGVWLMTGAASSGFGIGEFLGLACAVLYSIDIIIVNLLIRPGEASRLTAGQFLVVGLICAIASLCISPRTLTPRTAAYLLGLPSVGTNLVLLMLLPTVASFGIQFRFQPRIDPSRAALIYILEPVFASVYALVMTPHRLAPIAIAGAALILLANFAVEFIQSRSRDKRLPMGIGVFD